MTTNVSPAPDPWTRYEGPEELLADRSISEDEKRRLLAEWERDLQQLQTATEENMPGDTHPDHHRHENRTSDLLQRVSNCRLRLGEKSAS
jgi:hypothetical protein